MKIEYKKIRKDFNDIYEVSYGNASLGQFYQLEDGYYYYEPPNNCGALSSWVLLDLRDKLVDLNEEFDKEVNRLFNLLQEEKDGDDIIGHRG